MVPKGWEHTTFDNHIDCLTGFAFSSDGYSDEKNGTRLLRGDNIEPGKLRWVNAKFWPEIYSKKLNRYFLLEGDFVIALDRTWVSSGLKVAEVAKSDLPCLLVQRVMRIRSKKTLEQNLLRQYFSGYLFEQYVKKNQTATAVPHISPNDVKGFALLLPPLPEQKKIAQILSIWDRAILVTEKLLTNSQQQKKALMQQLLTGKKRLLDENGVRFSGEWEKTLLSKVCSIKTGKKDVNEGNPNGVYPFFTCANEPTRSDSYSYDCEALLIAGNGALGKTHYYKGKFEAYQRTYILSGFMGIDATYLYQYLQHWLGLDINREKQHSAMPYIKLGLLQSFNILLPSNKEQQKIASVLSAADTEISMLEKKFACLKDEKKALMQQLLTGKRRVVIDAVAA